jgi:hypothetical protein
VNYRQRISARYQTILAKLGPQLQKKARQQLARSKAAVLPDLPLPGTMARTIVQLIEKIES